MVAYEKSELEESARLCQEALKRGPANSEVLNRLGRALMDMRDLRGARAEFEAVLRGAGRSEGGPPG